MYSKIIQEYHQSVNSLNPDQAQHFVGPDLGPTLFPKVIMSAADDRSRHQQAKS